MNKEELIKQLVLLDQKELIQLGDYIYNFQKMINHSKKDNIFIRYIALRGYKSYNDFNKKHKITRDNSIYQAIRESNETLKSYINLKKILNIDDELFLNYLKEKVGE